MKRAITLSLLVVVVAAATFGCGLKSAMNTADEAVPVFHEQYNASQYEQMYAESDQALKEEVTEAQFLEFCRSLKADHGNVVRAKRTQVSANSFKGTDSFTHVSSVYEVTFENGVQSETFRWNIVDDKALLMSWNVNLSP